MGAKFRYLGTERGIVFIEDLDQGISVTNDAENVWRRAMSSYSTINRKHDRLVYKDTDGEWWELVATKNIYNSHCKGRDQFDIEFKRWHGHEWDILANENR